MLMLPSPQGKLMLPNRILSTPPKTYMNRGLTPKASKKVHHFLYPFTSMIQMSSARKLEASPSRTPDCTSTLSSATAFPGLYHPECPAPPWSTKAYPLPCSCRRPPARQSAGQANGRDISADVANAGSQEINANICQSACTHPDPHTRPCPLRRLPRRRWLTSASRQIPLEWHTSNT